MQTDHYNTNTTWTNLAGTPILSGFTYSSASSITYNSPVYYAMMMNGLQLTSFSAPDSLNAIDAGTPFIPLALSGYDEASDTWALVSRTCNENNMVGMSPPSVGTWFTFSMGGFTEWGIDTNWIGSPELKLESCLHPTTGAVKYDGPNSSEIDFTLQPGDMQQAFLD